MRLIALAKSGSRETRADEGADFRFRENYVAQADSLPALKAANSAPHANLNYMALSASFFGQRFNITERDLERYLGQPARATGVEGPRPIGPWKPDRFTTLPGGFHAAP